MSSLGRRMSIGFLVLIVLAAAGDPLRAQDAAGETAPDPFLQHQAQSVSLKDQIQEYFGYTPALACAPYLSMAAISGAALFAETEYARTSTNPVVRGICDNAPVQEARKYASLPLVLVLASFALLSYLASSGKLRGTVGKVMGMGEGTLMAGAYATLAAVGLAGSSVSEPARLALMGFDLPRAVLWGLAIAFALGAMLVVRFALDVLIWLSPFPLVDFLFESVKNVLALGLLALFFISPAAAAFCAALLLLISLVLYGWAMRVLGLTFGVVLRPILARLLPSLRPRLVEEEIVQRLGLPAPVLATPATALAVRGLPARRSGALIKTGEKLLFVPRTYLRRPRQLAIGQKGQRPVLSRGLFWLELRTTGPDGRAQRIALPKTPEVERLRFLLEAEDGGILGGARMLQKLADALGQGLQKLPVSARPPV